MQQHLFQDFIQACFQNFWENDNITNCYSCQKSKPISQTKKQQKNVNVQKEEKTTISNKKISTQSKRVNTQSNSKASSTVNKKQKTKKNIRKNSSKPLQVIIETQQQQVYTDNLEENKQQTKKVVSIINTNTNIKQNQLNTIRSLEDKKSKQKSNKINNTYSATQVCTSKTQFRSPRIQQHKAQNISSQPKLIVVQAPDPLNKIQQAVLLAQTSLKNRLQLHILQFNNIKSEEQNKFQINKGKSYKIDRTKAQNIVNEILYSNSYTPIMSKDKQQQQEKSLLNSKKEQLQLEETKVRKNQEQNVSIKHQKTQLLLQRLDNLTEIISNFQKQMRQIKDAIVNISQKSNTYSPTL